MNKRTPNRTALGSVLVSALAIQHAPVIAEEATDAQKVSIVGEAINILDKNDTTATKMDLSLKDTGRSIVQLDSQQIDDLAIKDLREAFDYVAGFRGNGPADRNFVSRGISTSIDNILVDGLRSLQGGEAGTGSKFPSTFNLESASFLRGPAGILNGESSGGGVINITTKKPQEEAETTLGISTRSYMSGDTGYGKRNSASLSVDSTGSVGDSDVLYRIIGEYTPSGEGFQSGREIDEKLLDAALTFKLGDKTTLTPSIEYTDRYQTGGSSYADGVFDASYFSGEITTFADPTNRGEYYGSDKDKGENSSRSLSLRLDHEFNEDWSLTSQIRRNNTESEALDLYISDSSGLNNSVGDEIVDRKWVFAKGEDEYNLFDLSTQGKFTTGSLEHHIVAGISYRDLETKFERNFQDNADALGNNTISVSNPDNQIVGAIPSDLTEVDYSPKEQKDTNIYFKDRVSYGDFTFTAGLGYVKQKQSGEDYNGSSSDTIWDVGAIYSVNKNLNLFATYSRSYDPINISDISQYGLDGVDYKPVEGKNLELGFKGSFLDGKLNTSVTAFHLEQKNSTSRETINGVRTLIQNTDVGFRSKGVEIDAQFKITPNLTSTLSYAYTRAADTSGDDEGVQADNTPRNSIALWNSYRFTGKYNPIRLGLGLRYEGSIKDGGYEIPSYYEVDLGAYYETPNWDAGLTIRNALDKNRAEAKANWVTVQTNEPRSLNLDFKYRF